jgi:undecaprenyl-diphosphatase
MTLLHSIIISVLQGVSELFPVSSLGHAVLLPRLLHWGIDEKSESWLAFLVALHIGTAVALLVYFRDQWIGVVKAFARGIQRGQISQDHDERLAWMVILGTVPAGLVGFVLKDPLRSLFASPAVAASFLIVNGVIMLAGERRIESYARPAVDGSVAVAASGESATDGSIGRYRDITQLGWKDAAIVGFAQVGALIPGISRSGITMVAGLAAGLTHEAAARYTFLLATPIIGAAGVLEVPKLFDSAGRTVLGYALLGVVLAGVAAYISVRFLMRYFQEGRLYPFAYYSVSVGIGSLILLALT